MPNFCHSENHAGLQIADIIASSLISPIACYEYLNGLLDTNVHVNPYAINLKKVFGFRLKSLQYQFTSNGEITGGIEVFDPNTDKTSDYLFSN